MIACSGNLASRSVALSGPGGSANLARSAKKTREVWRDTPSGAMVHSSDSDIALSSCVSTPSRARHPCPSGRKLLMFLRINFSSQPHELLGDVQPDMRKLKTMPRVIAPVMPRVLPRVIQIRALTRSLELVASMAWLGDVRS